ncbi:hypothetical protein CGCSCA4_v014759 [Colletotrichum siamense]|uniref:Uncharacterized protein n=1 Tax=Colletotrichum siamense TaxID=690259 RepID=A0A9P5BN11_COLSI|nr:hypothetical protein CGCSCA4_v014759 [Colletotrichum siamense]KAF4845062.1 hypothetical protein CGCSCA2_v013769 [Colletotrichum siamense]
MSFVFDDPLDRRVAPIEAQRSLPIANRLYRPGRLSDSGLCIWWPADDGDASFGAHLGEVFRDSKTAPYAILTTPPDPDLEQHGRGA